MRERERDKSSGDKCCVVASLLEWPPGREIPHWIDDFGNRKTKKTWNTQYKATNKHEILHYTNYKQCVKTNQPQIYKYITIINKYKVIKIYVIEIKVYCTYKLCTLYSSIELFVLWKCPFTGGSSGINFNQASSLVIKLLYFVSEARVDGNLFQSFLERTAKLCSNLDSALPGILGIGGNITFGWVLRCGFSINWNSISLRTVEFLIFQV